MYQQKVSVETLFGIRDARGFTPNEKTFLFVVATRGTMKASRDTALGDMGFSKNTFYRVKDSLIGKGVLIEHPGQFNPMSGKRDHTFYKVDSEVLATFVPKDDSHTGNPVHTVDLHDSHTGNPHAVDDSLTGNPHGHDSQSHTEDSQSDTDDSHTGKEDSLCGDNKVTGKVTKKVTGKDDASASAAASKPEVLGQRETEDSQSDTPSSLSRFNLAPSILHEYRKEKSRGLEHLARLFEEEEAGPEIQEGARSLFEDETWKPNYRGIQRAAWALTYAKPEPVHKKAPKEPWDQW
jgi:hypothetical protein